MTASTPDLAALEAEMRARALEAHAIEDAAHLLYNYVGRLGVHGDEPLQWNDRSDEHQGLWIKAIREVITALRYANIIAVLDGKDAEIARLREKLRAMAAALEPFALWASDWTEEQDEDGYDIDPVMTCDEHAASASDLRRAARVLSAYRAGEAEHDGGSDV